jgi:hypothetical protein
MRPASKALQTAEGCRATVTMSNIHLAALRRRHYSCLISYPGLWGYVLGKTRESWAGILGMKMKGVANV